MKLNLKTLGAVAAFAAAAFSAHAQTAGIFDLVVGFKQTGATNDVIVDFGNVANYTAPGTYNLGNFGSVFSANFSNWNTATGTGAVNWGAAATWKDPADVANSQAWVTKQWTTAAGTLGVQNSAAYAAISNTTTNTGNLNLGKVYVQLDTYTVGAAETVGNTALNSWTKAMTTGNAFGLVTATQFNNQASRLATGETFSASDLYKIGNSSEPTVTEYVGTFALYQNGDLTFTVAAIPEPSTYAAILGVATLGFAALRRRKQNQLVA